MTDKLVELKNPITVYGIQAKTSWKKEETLDQAIVHLMWDIINVDGYPEPSQKETLYGVVEHESKDDKSEFLFTTGAAEPSELESIDLESASLGKTQINAGEYLMFEKRGKLAETTVKLWVEVWEHFASDACEYERRFETDFEEYIEYNPDGCLVRVYVGVNKK